MGVPARAPPRSGPLRTRRLPRGNHCPPAHRPVLVVPALALVSGVAVCAVVALSPCREPHRVPGESAPPPLVPLEFIAVEICYPLGTRSRLPRCAHNGTP